MSGILPRDENHVTAIGFESSTTPGLILPGKINELTGRILTSMSGGGGSGITRTIVVTSGNVTAGSTASIDYVYIVSGAHTVTLPTAVGNENLYTIKNAHSASVAVATTSLQTIDGVTSASLIPDQSISVISDGSNWNIV